ncbi:MAG: hypothetical protein ACRYHQ_05210, partial [Janthinobacterium lividum]
MVIENAVWAAWQESRDEPTCFVQALVARGVILSSDEDGRVCVPTGPDRLEPLLRLLSRRSCAQGG